MRSLHFETRSPQNANSLATKERSTVEGFRNIFGASKDLGKRLSLHRPLPSLPSVELLVAAADATAAMPRPMMSARNIFP